MALWKRMGSRAATALLLALAFALGGCNGSSSSSSSTPPPDPGAPSQFLVEVDGVGASDPAEQIYVRRIGNGPKVIVLVPGNNTSGASFDPLLQVFGTDAYKAAYTVYTFDYRGSGNSSYNTTITGLADFAADFERVMDALETSHGFPASDVALVGYSMGFAVALEMTIANPARYSQLIGLAPVGTRGVRVDFAVGQGGTDALGMVYADGDRVPVHDDMLGVAATALQQSSWQGANRTPANVKFVWDMLVYNDMVQYDFATFTATDEAFFGNPAYQATFDDVLNIDYMPHSLYYSHKFNVSDEDVVDPTPNADGLRVIVPGDGRLNAAGLSGKTALLVKASTDFVNWRGDQVIYDNYVATSKFDLKEAGANTTAIMIDPDQRYDHGFPITHPSQTAQLLHTFIQGDLTPQTATDALGGVSLNFYEHGENTFETNVFTGF